MGVENITGGGKKPQQKKQQKQTVNGKQAPAKKKTLKIHKPAKKTLAIRQPNKPNHQQQNTYRAKTQLLIDRFKVMGGLPKSIPIAGKDFMVGSVSPVLVKHLREEWDRPKLTILELAPGLNARKELITQIIGAEAIPFMERQSRFYYIDYLEQRIRGLRRYFK